MYILDGLEEKECNCFFLYIFCSRIPRSFFADGPATLVDFFEWAGA